MNREISPEQLESDIQRMLYGNRHSTSTSGSLLAIACDLRLLPSQEFRNRLRNDLLQQAETAERASPKQAAEFLALDRDPVPKFGEQRYSALPADPRSFALSFLSHAAVVVLIASGIWVGPHLIPKTNTVTSELNYLPMPLGDDAPHGGGSGGDRRTIQASRGTPPKFSEQQLVPPAIVVRNPSPKLQVDPTVLGPPQIKLPQSDRIGDLMSHNVVIPSNGTGSRSGMGSNSGTGIGDGGDGGVGPGSRGGFGGETFRPGNGVSAPRAIYDPDPEYSDEARRAKYQGTVVLALVVDASGHARDIRIARSLGMGLDDKAIAAVEKWRFAPGMKDGHAVATQVNVEVNFRLY